MLTDPKKVSPEQRENRGCRVRSVLVKMKTFHVSFGSYANFCETQGFFVYKTELGIGTNKIDELLRIIII